ncbi:Enoyl-CoA hydratase [Candidatus Defluviicoccus seviourii]|uniref:Enoyl-CoA hydratase n=2 Tax=root TaxID=1 RepID=A0A564WHT7_9PROT|nr:Enoyl-CoA hydratase [uncultured Defluviicoccus sp.]VUX47538.1 Enoyl-CoA hydratase [Candidatus Defluviicoccus seviourii]
MADALVCSIDEAGVGRIRFNRPQIHNAFDNALIESLGAAIEALGADARVRAVVIAAEGASFCAGGDLAWMLRMGEAPDADNVADALKLARVLGALATLPKPTLALVQGPAYGGGVGVVAACDIAIAAEEARFALTEVRLGIIPAVISPYVVAAIGARAAARYALMALPFDAAEALRLGLVHEVVQAGELESAGARTLAALGRNSTAAMAEAKALMRAVAGRPVDAALMEETAQAIARARARREAQDRITAFLKRKQGG